MMDVCNAVWKLVRPHVPSPFLISPYEYIAAVMLMETFDRLTHKEKYVWDVRGLFLTLNAFLTMFLDIWSCE